jgi:hypothetical protein
MEMSNVKIPTFAEAASRRQANAILRHAQDEIMVSLSNHEL